MTMTQREVFDKVKNHLLVQGARAQDGVGACQYRDDEGLMCAVGCLISDEHYSTALEGHSIRRANMEPEPGTQLVRDALVNSGVVLDASTIDMLYDLQLLHDETWPESWAEELAEIERKYFGEG